MAEKVRGPVDILINSAGYFYGPVETLDTMAFKDWDGKSSGLGPMVVSRQIHVGLSFSS